LRANRGVAALQQNNISQPDATKMLLLCSKMRHHAILFEILVAAEQQHLCSGKAA
jgi:hypothetical protein